MDNMHIYLIETYMQSVITGPKQKVVGIKFQVKTGHKILLN
jgi:hypothetical protein